MKDVFGDEVAEDRRGRPIKGAAIAGLIVGAALSALLLVSAPNASGLAAILFLLCPIVFVFAAGVVVLVDRLWLPVRVFVQTAVVAVLFAPSIVVGHGVAPAPALLVLFMDGQQSTGVICIVVTAAIVFPFFLVRAMRAAT